MSFGDAHKETAATIHAATEAFKSNKKITLQTFDRLTCPTGLPRTNHPDHTNLCNFGAGQTKKERAHNNVIKNTIQDC